MSELYDRLCEATAEALFGAEKAGLPVYTLAEPDVLADIARTAGIVGDPFAGYLGTVRESLHLGDEGVSVLRWHARVTERHARSRRDTPPSLPLLVVLTMAAEQMHAGACQRRLKTDPLAAIEN